MINVCNKFAIGRNLKFSTNVNVEKSKTKCIIFSRKKVYKENYAPICLDNAPLPYVDKLVHLGITVQSDNSMAVDMSIKRARFIGKVNSLNQEFHFSSAAVKAKLYDLYCCSYYCSNLYDLFNRNCDKIYKSQ